MMRKCQKTLQDYCDIVAARDIECVKILKDNLYKAEWLCLVCGYSWIANYFNVKHGSGCPDCSSHVKKTIQDYHDLVKNKNIKYIGKKIPKTTHDKTIWQCLKCQYVWFSTYNNIQQSRGCPLCAKKVKKVEKDYYALAESCGFKWVGGVLPKKTIDKTLWECKKGHRWLARYHDIKNGRGCPICAAENMLGKNNPNWSGGYSYKDYCPIFFDKEYKEVIRSRDNYECQNPYCYKKAKRLNIHHIDYDKKNCGPDNLITLCVGCNGRANKDRDWHIAWYQTIMNHKYGYNYKINRILGEE